MNQTKADHHPNTGWINSVERISDGTIFKIGDYIEDKIKSTEPYTANFYRKGAIVGLAINDDNYIQVTYGDPNKPWITYIENINHAFISPGNYNTDTNTNKIKKNSSNYILFVTEDKHEYDGLSDVYAVDKKTFTIEERNWTGCLKDNRTPKLDHENKLYFKDIENAKEYIAIK